MVSLFSIKWVLNITFMYGLCVCGLAINRMTFSLFIWRCGKVQAKWIFAKILAALLHWVSITFISTDRLGNTNMIGTDSEQRIFLVKGKPRLKWTVSEQRGTQKKLTV